MGIAYNELENYYIKLIIFLTLRCVLGFCKIDTLLFIACKKKCVY